LNRDGYEPAELPITPEMIEAGASALMRLAGGCLEANPYSPELLVREVLDSALFASKCHSE